MQVLTIVALTIAAAVAAPHDLHLDDKPNQRPPSFAEVPSSTSDAENVKETIHLPEELEKTEFSKKKRSATTTFCVEVRPNNPYQKPYELCESGNEVYTVPSDVHQQAAYNSAPAYNVQVAPAASGPSVPSSAAPIYGPPPKPVSGYGAPSAAYSATKNTYSSPVASNNGYVQSAPDHSAAHIGHSKSYGAPKKYRASEDDPQSQFVDDEFEDEDDSPMRSAGYGYGGGYGGYGGGYTADTGIIKFVGKKGKKKGHGGHSGLVITCQPSLAGYASGVGGGHGTYGGGAGGYGGYRNSNPENLNGLPQQMRSTNMETIEMADHLLGRTPYAYGNTGFSAPSFSTSHSAGYQNGHSAAFQGGHSAGFQNGMPSNSGYNSGPAFSGYGAPAVQTQGYGGFSAHPSPMGPVGPAPHAIPAASSVPAASAIASQSAFGVATPYGAPTSSGGYAGPSSSFNVPIAPSQRPSQQSAYHNFGSQVPSSQGYGAPTGYKPPQKFNVPTYQPQQQSYVAPAAYRSAEGANEKPPKSKDILIQDKERVGKIQEDQALEGMKTLTAVRPGWSNKVRSSEGDRVDMSKNDIEGGKETQ